jgi:xanthine dehydrogenase accessory factor
VVSDDRSEFVTLEAVPSADEHILTPLSELTDKINITSETYIMLTTRGVPIDVEGLPSLLDSEAGFIGVIGSKRRWDTSAKLLAEQGVAQEKIDRVVSPMGLELNAETPEEIAVSMLAEIIMLRRGGSGEHMAHDSKV